MCSLRISDFRLQRKAKQSKAFRRTSFGFWPPPPWIEFLILYLWVSEPLRLFPRRLQRQLGDALCFFHAGLSILAMYTPQAKHIPQQSKHSGHPPYSQDFIFICLPSRHPIILSLTIWRNIFRTSSSVVFSSSSRVQQFRIASNISATTTKNVNISLRNTKIASHHSTSQHNTYS